MTISRRVWPRDPVDQDQILRMILIAQTCQPGWQPPADFASIDEQNPTKFRKSLGHMQRHTRELWKAMPRKAQLSFYVASAMAGLNYADDALSCLDHVAVEALEDAPVEAQQKLDRVAGAIADAIEALGTALVDALA